MASDLAAARRLLEDLFAGAGLDDGSEDASDGEHFDGEDEAAYWCPSPPPDASCPIASLPPGTLEGILLLTGEDGARLEALSTSLVARAWRLPSQALLWRDLALLPGDEPYFDAMCDSPACGKFRTRDVIYIGGRYMGDGRPMGEETSRLLRSLRGLEKLSLSDNVQLDANMFAAPSLFELTELSLQDCDFLPLPSPITLPFRLEQLELHGDDLPPHLLTSLLTSSTTSLKSLVLNISSTPNPALLSHFPLIAPTLARLSLHDISPSFLPLVPLCTSLTSLHLAPSIPVVAFITLLHSLPPSLSTLKVGANLDNEDDEMDRLLADLKLSLVVGQMGSDGTLEGLERLVVVLEGEAEAGLEVLPGAKKLGEECERWGVVFEVDEVLRGEGEF